MKSPRNTVKRKVTRTLEGLFLHFCCPFGLLKCSIGTKFSSLLPQMSPSPCLLLIAPGMLRLPGTLGGCKRASSNPNIRLVPGREGY